MKTLVKDRVILLNTYPYSDSSLIIKAFGEQCGSLDVIAKGIRKKKDSFILQRLSEYELTLYPPKEGGLYLLKESNLSKERHYANAKSWATALCGAEFMQKQLISNDEHQLYFELFTSFLDFLLSFDEEPLPVFWRLLYRIIHLQGFELKTSICSQCKTQKLEYAYTKHDAKLYCQECASHIYFHKSLHVFGEQAAYILYHLEHIGNHLKQISLSQSTIQEINNFFADYYFAHNSQTLKLKSLSVLEQFYL